MDFFSIFMVLFFAFMVSISLRVLRTDKREAKRIRAANNNLFIARRLK